MLVGIILSTITPGTGLKNSPKKLEWVAMYVLSSICANPPKAPTMPSSIWKVACVLMLKRWVRLSGLLGSPGMAPGIPPYMPPYMPP